MSNGPDPKNDKTVGIGEVVYYYRGGDMRNPPTACLVTGTTPEGVLSLTGFLANSNVLDFHAGVRYHQDPYFQPSNEKFIPKRQQLRGRKGVWDYPTPEAFASGVETSIASLKLKLQTELENAQADKQGLIGMKEARRALAEDDADGLAAADLNISTAIAVFNGTLARAASTETSIASLKAELKAAKEARLRDAKSLDSNIAKLKAELDAKDKPTVNEPKGDHDKRRRGNQPAPTTG